LSSNKYGFGLAETMDRSLGNREGWEEVEFKTVGQGAATHVYAAFSPDLKGKTKFNPFLPFFFFILTIVAK